MSAINLVSPATSAADLGTQEPVAGPSTPRASPSTSERTRVRWRSEERSMTDRPAARPTRRSGPSSANDDAGDAASDNEIVFTGEHLASVRQLDAHQLAEQANHQRPNEQRINEVLHSLDERLDHYRFRMAQLFNQRALQEEHPERPPPRTGRPVGFGAVIRAGTRSIQSRSNTPYPPIPPGRVRALYEQGPHVWARYVSDPTSNSSNPIPGVVFVPESSHHKDHVVNFDPAHDRDSGPIELDEEGDVIAKRPYILRCANCPTPLLLSSAYRSPEDTVWVLRCGHMIDQSCLRKVGQPIEADPAIALADAEALIAGPGKRKRKRTTPRKPRRHVWHCPVESCGRPHGSVEGPPPLYGWTQDDEIGALQLYA